MRSPSWTCERREERRLRPAAGARGPSGGARANAPTASSSAAAALATTALTTTALSPTATLSTARTTATLATVLATSAHAAPVTARLLNTSVRREHPLMALVQDDVGGLVEALEHAHDVPAVVGHDLYYLVHHAIQHGRHRCRPAYPTPTTLQGAAAAARCASPLSVARRRVTGEPWPSITWTPTP